MLATFLQATDTLKRCISVFCCILLQGCGLDLVRFSYKACLGKKTLFVFRSKRCWKMSGSLFKNIQWSHAYKCCISTSNSGLWLVSLSYHVHITCSWLSYGEAEVMAVELQERKLSSHWLQFEIRFQHLRNCKTSEWGEMITALRN